MCMTAPVESIASNPFANNLPARASNVQPDESSEKKLYMQGYKDQGNLLIKTQRKSFLGIPYGQETVLGMYERTRRKSDDGSVLCIRYRSR